MKLRDLESGEVLLREGDPPGAIYVILGGRLRVLRGEPAVELAVLSTGEVIGELGPILNRPRSASVQAVDEARVLEIVPAELPRLVQQHQSLVRVITTALRDRAGVSA